MIGLTPTVVMLCYISMMNTQLLIAASCLALSMTAWAQTTSTARSSADDERPELPGSPPPLVEPQEEGELPPKKVGRDQPAPTINIRKEGNQTIEEYSMSGRVYMMKITPENGITYYLIDTDGDGEFDTKDFDDNNGIRPVYYKLFEWK